MLIITNGEDNYTTKPNYVEAMRLYKSKTILEATAGNSTLELEKRSYRSFSPRYRHHLEILDQEARI